MLKQKNINILITGITISVIFCLPNNLLAKNIDIGLTGDSVNILGSNLCLDSACISSWNSITGSWLQNGTNVYYNSGNVGIGTSAPQGALDIISTEGFRTMGPVVFGGSLYTGSGTRLLTVDNSGNVFASTMTEAVGLPATSLSGQTLRSDGSSWVASSNLFNNGTTVGIGTTNPDPIFKLDVAGHIILSNGGTVIANEDSELVFSPSMGMGALVFDATNGIFLNGSDLFPDAWSGYRAKIGSASQRFAGLYTNVITDNGTNLGIGKTNPAYKLDVVGGGQFTQRVFGVTPGETDTLALTTVEYVNAMVGGSGGVGTGTSGQTLRHNGTAWVANSTLYNNGSNVGIGLTNPSHKLDILGSINIDDSSAYKYAGYDVFKLAEKDDWLGYTSTIIGIDAGDDDIMNWTDRQTVIGYRAGYQNEGYGQSAIGYSAGISNTGGGQTALGYNAGKNNTGELQTTIGYYSGFINTGYGQVALGGYSGNDNTGDYQTAIGENSGMHNSGDYQIAIGINAGMHNLGNHQIAIGDFAGMDGSSNRSISIGSWSNYSGSNDTIAIGYYADPGNKQNQFVLQQANINTTPLIQGDFLTGNIGIGTADPTAKLHVVGDEAEFSHRVFGVTPGETDTLALATVEYVDAVAGGDGETSLWGGTLDGNIWNGTTGAGNVGIGTSEPSNKIHVQDLIEFRNSDWRTAIGFESGKYDLGQYNTWIGYQAGSANNNTNKEEYADYNTAVGYQALYSNETGSENSAYGAWVLWSNTLGDDNSAFGTWALYANTTGGSNTAYGRSALSSNTTGNGNAAHGAGALYNNTIGGYNTAQGTNALSSNTTGSNNAVQGVSALGSNTTGGHNTAQGNYAGRFIANGSTPLFVSNNSVFLGASTKALADNSNNEIVIGYNAIGNGNNSVTLGGDTILKTVLKGNVGIGTTNPTAKLHVVGDEAEFSHRVFGVTPGETDTLALATVEYVDAVAGGDGETSLWGGTLDGNIWNGTTGAGNVGIGTSEPNNLLMVEGLINFDNSTYNTNVGYLAGANIDPGATHNTYFGYMTGASSSTAPSTLADRNSAFGYQSLFSNTSGYDITAIGYRALYSNENSYRNVAVGSNSLFSNTTGNNNVALGTESLYSSVNAGQNTAVGYRAMYSSVSGSWNTAFGYMAMYSNATGSNNVALGPHALYANTSGAQNVAIGLYSLRNNTTAINNVAIGYQSLYYNTSGGSNAAIGVGAMQFNTTGTNNSVLGTNSLYSNIDGRHNVAVGYMAGRHLEDGTDNSTPDYSIYIGGDASSLHFNAQNEIVIGYNAIGAGSNSVVLGSDVITKTVLKGNVGIGTTTPSQKLYVVGGGEFTNTAYGITPGETDTLALATVEYVNSITGSLGGDGLAAGTLGQTLRNDGSVWEPASNLFNSGTNIGIGTTNPTKTLDIVGGVNLEVTTSNTAGVIFKNGEPFIHDFKPTDNNGGNIFIGKFSGNFTMGGASVYEASYNTAVGAYSLYGLTTGRRNVAIGYDAFRKSQTSYESIAIGYQAGLETIGPGMNIFIGANSGRYNLSGNGNTMVGRASGQYATGNYNTLMGYGVGAGVLSSSPYVNAVLVGAFTGDALTTGSGNTFLGYSSGSSVTSGAYNTFIGHNTGSNMTTGSRNIVIGYGSQVPSDTGNYQLSIGNLIYGTVVNGIGSVASTGNIGIGTTAPTQKLDVAGGGQFTNLVYGASPGETDTLALATVEYVNAKAGSGGGGTSLWSGTLDGNIWNGTAGAGNVGIGTTNPTSKLHVNGSFRSGAISDNGAGSVTIGTDIMDSITIGGSGLSVYSGITSFIENVDFQGSNVEFSAWTTTDFDSTVNINAVSYGITPGGTEPLALATVEYVDAVAGGGGGTSLWGGTLDGNIWNGTAGAGNVGIGTTNPRNKLEVNGDITVNAGTVIYKDNSRFLHNYGSSNVFLGIDSGNLTLTGAFNSGFGIGTLSSLTSGNDNTAIGEVTMLNVTSGSENSSLGTDNLWFNTTGSGNTSIGFRSMAYGISPSFNTSVGVYALSSNDAQNNSALGYHALYTNTAGSNNIAVGYKAGYHETGSNKLFIDSISRGSEALGREQSLIYGEANATPANQKLSLGGGGNVGIGTTNPADKLVVRNGTGEIRFGGWNGRMLSAYNDGALSNFDFNANATFFNSHLILGSKKEIFMYDYAETNQSYGKIYIPSNETLSFALNGADRMVINSTGNIGIGTNSPGQKLDVSGNININEGSSYLYSGLQALKLSKGTSQYFVNTSLGVDAGVSSTGANQTALGYMAGYENTGATQTVVGNYAGLSNIGANQTALGSNAGNLNTGVSQTALGVGAGYNNTGNYQTSLGVGAGENNVANNQVAIGVGAGYGNSGADQISIGNYSGYLNSGINQTALGTNAGSANLGAHQTAIGMSAGSSNTQAHQTALGVDAGNTNTGANQTAIGVGAGYSNTGVDQVTIGFYAGSDNIGANQTTIGNSSGQNNQGSNQTAIGRAAGYFNTGAHQAALGADAGYENTGGNQSAVGVGAGASNTGINQSVLGFYAGEGNIGPGQTAIGTSAGQQNQGEDQTAVGRGAGYLNTAIHQTVLGVDTGYYNSGLRQTAIGVGAGGSNTGNDQIALGFYSGYQNTGHRVTGVGNRALYGNQASDVVAIGYQAGEGNTLANQFIVKQNNINSTPLIQGNFSTGNVGIGTTNPLEKLHVVGNARVSGTISSETGSDFAEEFTVQETIEPGTVVVMADDGYKSVKPSTRAYDKTVVGVVSGSASIITGKVESDMKAVVGLIGVVDVKVINKNGIIKKGDLLTTSSVEGKAMKAKRAILGSIIGKALEDMEGKEDTIKVLINLQ